MMRSPKILAGEEVGNETSPDIEILVLGDGLGSNANNYIKMLTENINGKIEVPEVDPIFCELDNRSGEVFQENNSGDYASAFKPEDDPDSDTPRGLSNDFRSNEIGLKWCLKTKLFVEPVPVVPEECQPPNLYIATLDPIRNSPDIQMPVLTIATKNSPASKIPELKSSILEMEVFERQGLGIYASASSLDINTTAPPALEVSLLDDGTQEIIESELETSVNQISVSGSPSLPVFPDWDLEQTIEEIAVNIYSNMIADIEENPGASNMEQIFGELLEFNDLGIDSNNNECTDEPDPALIQLLSMTMSQNTEPNRKYATTSQFTRNTIRDKFKTAFANMDKNCDVYDAEMLRLLKLYPLELVPEEILNYYLGRPDDY